MVDMPVSGDSKSMAGGEIRGNVSIKSGTLVEVDVRKDRVQIDIKEDVPLVAQSVAQAAVPLVAQRVRATSGTRMVSSNRNSSLQVKLSGGTKPHSIVGHEWRQMQNGWVLWRRVPSKSENGNRTSERKYVAFYSNKTIEVMYGKRQKQ
jgi:hypothetical protein